MNNLFTKLAGLSLAATVLFASCAKEEDKVVIKPGDAPALTASATSAALVQTNASATAVTYTWTPVDYGYQAAISYALQFAKAGTNFASNVYEVNVGSATSKTFTVAELNSVFAGVDCNSANKATALDVRVKSSVGAAVPNITSAAKSIQATPYPSNAAPADRWAIIGSATPGGWDKDTYMTYDFCTQSYKVTLALTAAEFKFRANGGWAVNLGGSGGTLKSDGPNIPVPAAGTYDVELNPTATPAPTYKITKK